MSIRNDVFTLLDRQVEPTEIMEQLNIDAPTMATYKYQWKKARGIKATPAKSADELADKIFNDTNGKEEVKTEVTEKKHFTPKGQSETKKGLQLVAEHKTYKGEYGEYTIVNGMLTIKLDNITMPFTKISLAELVKELDKLGGLM